ncbi:MULTISPECIES: RNA polymerase sigma factor [unclassified Siphonobacter]|uniref:RNA polymerase sigma factor n=1 Tax=unclassified Siphonobacter TaxID=2635712 RepID=UPI00277F4A1B|nr:MULTISPECIES: sigma-70 family RNA polymerase sigma factor [unclassified Siphonobacter]MDQ1089811.1 RNA polymerase sigma-70 factor (family 1) [Siphonobacter sp. SORGH_AS_1065]MDR6197676.1 RNA polymerase sigma-70 factor (family 1) [Siphonobacter sp. SORGH_AS_0500]
MQSSYTELESLVALSQDKVEAFDFLYHLYKQPVYGNIFKIVKQEDLAEDLLQEVFITLWENRHSLQLDRPVAGWLFVVSHNKALSFLKKKLKEALVVSSSEEFTEQASPEETLDEEEYSLQLSMIKEAVDQLPNRKREVFHQLRFEGKTTEEVAENLGISVQSVRDYLKQATRQVRTHIQERGKFMHASSASILIMMLDQF